MSLLSGLNPRPSVLVMHFFMVALFGVGRCVGEVLCLRRAAATSDGVRPGRFEQPALPDCVELHAWLPLQAHPPAAHAARCLARRTAALLCGLHYPAHHLEG